MLLVYRADLRGPVEIFNIGFQPRFAGGIKIQEGGQMTGGVSTTTDIRVALRYAAAYGGWVYAAWATKGVSVLDHLLKKGFKGAIPNALSQKEFAAESIPRQHVICARQARQNGAIAEMYGPVEANGLCTVDQTQKALAVTYLSMDVTVDNQYAH